MHLIFCLLILYLVTLLNSNVSSRTHDLFLLVLITLGIFCVDSHLQVEVVFFLF